MIRNSVILALVFICTSALFAQGQLFSEAEAEQKFGPVQAKTKVNSAMIMRLLDKNDHLMFGLDKASGKVNIHAKDRSPVFQQYLASDNEVLHVYASEKIKEVIQKGGSNHTFIEQRDEVLSLSNGTYVLEIALPCPPCCPSCPDWPDWPPEDY